MTATLELKPIPADPKAKTAKEAPEEPQVVSIVKKAIGAGGETAMDITSLTRLYLKLRAAEADLKLQAKQRLAPLSTGMALLEGFFLNKMNELQVDSLKNEAGTPYKTTKVSITVEDNEEWLGFVLTEALANLPVKDESKVSIKNLILGSGMMALLESRASKTAVEAWMAEAPGEDGAEPVKRPLPPGLVRREEASVNLRAS